MSKCEDMICVYKWTCVNIYIYIHPWKTHACNFFPECVARVPVSLWGSGGGAVFARRCLTVRNRPQPSAWETHGHAYSKFSKRVRFWRFPASRSFISRRRPGTLWHFTMFHDVSRTRFLWQRNTLETSDVILGGRRSTSDVSPIVFFCESYCQGWREVVTRCKFCGRGGAFRHVMKIDGSLARNIDFGAGSEETRWKTLILKLRSVKFTDVSHEMHVLRLQHVSSRVAGFCGAGAVSMGEAAKPFLVKSCKTSFRVVLQGRRGTSWHFHVSAKVSKMVLCGRRSTFETSVVILRGRRSSWDVLCWVLSANRNVKAAWGGDNVQIA